MTIRTTKNQPGTPGIGQELVPINSSDLDLDFDQGAASGIEFSLIFEDVEIFIFFHVKKMEVQKLASTTRMPLFNADSGRGDHVIQQVQKIRSVR